MTATIRRACAACGRVRLRRVLSVAAVGFGVVTAYTASHAFAIVFVFLAVAAVGVHRAPDVVFERPGDVYTIGVIQSDGLTDREMARRIGIIQARNEYEKEKSEERRRKARKNSNKNTPTTSKL